MMSKIPAGVPLSDADLLKLMTANGPAIARLIEKAAAGEPEHGLTSERSDDEVRATEHAASVRAALEPVCAAIDAAKADGFVVIFGLGANADGKQVVVQFDIAKHYSV
jgi:hypothetical protein